MKYRISGTTQISTEKTATYGYKLFETDSLEEMAEYLNTHATVPCQLKNGYRRTDNITEIFPWIRLDCDKEGESELIDEALKETTHIKKPSTNNDKSPWKWHYFIPIENVSQKYDVYKLQYYKFLADMGIEISDKSLASLVQNTNHYRGDLEAAMAKTTIKLDKVWIAPTLQAPAPRERVMKSSDTSEDEVKKILTSIDPSCTYFDWLKVGMALYDWCPTRGFELFDNWSKQSDKYHEGTTQDKWDDFEDNSRGEVTLGTLNYLAYGEKVDSLTLFKTEAGSVEPVSTSLKEKPTSPRELLQEYFITNDDIQGLEDQVYLIDGLILKGGLGAMIGDSGSGKSHLLFCLTLQILEKYDGMDAYFFDIDSGLQYTKERFQHIQSKVGSRFEYLSSHKKLEARTTLDMLSELSKYNLSNSIIIIDSLTELAEGEINESKKVSPILATLKMLRDAGASVLLIHHNNKTGRYAGSFNIRSVMDYSFMVTKDDNRITLDIDKQRGVFTSRTYQIVDFQKCAIEEVGYKSGSAIRKEQENIFKNESDRVMDDDKIKMIRSIIESLDIPNKKNIKETMHKELGMNERTTDKLLIKYRDIEWAMESTQIEGSGGRPNLIFKCVENS